ncbi:MAG TPA: GrpB family protein [Candidatus Limnocylindrales bacterium]
MDKALKDKLRAVGLDEGSFGDPAEAWQRLHDRFGTRATLLDRYSLEAAARAIPVESLVDDDRARLTMEVIEAHWGEFEIVGGSDRIVSDPIEVVEYNPEWPAQFAAWRDRLATALGPTAKRIDHVGSTSVPGLAAKPIIDIQISVIDVTDEAAYAPAIDALGAALRSRDIEHRYFRPAGERPRDVQIHVCDAGSDWARAHLLFRDYLRTHAAPARAYAEMKRGAAARYPRDRIAYNETKTDFILDQLEQAERWAADTGWRSE